MHVKIKVGVVNWRQKCELLDIHLKNYTKKASIRPDFVWPLKITIIHRSALLGYLIKLLLAPISFIIRSLELA
jgi:hypothetical protein